jgi:hypothetical protein
VFFFPSSSYLILGVPALDHSLITVVFEPTPDTCENTEAVIDLYRRITYPP